MEQLGYYAKSKHGKDLFQFKWDEHNNFYIIKNGKEELAYKDDYEILEIGYFISK